MIGPGAGLPLRPGDTGDGVRDLQERLVAAGFPHGDDPLGTFGPGTVEALRRFRIARRLPPALDCDDATWSALVEAGHELGDRLLYLTKPELRGDDVAALQHDLGSLGFDAGKIDGIFGPRTEAALADFQRNAGLAVDNICGPVTVAALVRFRTRADDPRVAHLLREQENRRRLGGLAGRKVAVAEAGGLAVVVDEVTRHLVGLGALVAPVHHPDAETRAEEANRAGAAVYLGLAVEAETPGCAAAFFASPRAGFESTAGRHLAELLECEVAGALLVPRLGAEGLFLPELRKTSMPAVVLTVGAAAHVAERARNLAVAVGTSLDTWMKGED